MNSIHLTNILQLLGDFNCEASSEKCDHSELPFGSCMSRNLSFQAAIVNYRALRLAGLLLENILIAASWLFRVANCIQIFDLNRFILPHIRYNFIYHTIELFLLSPQHRVFNSDGLFNSPLFHQSMLIYQNIRLCFVFFKKRCSVP